MSKSSVNDGLGGLSTDKRVSSAPEVRTAELL